MWKTMQKLILLISFMFFLLLLFFFLYEKVILQKRKGYKHISYKLYVYI